MPRIRASCQDERLIAKGHMARTGGRASGHTVNNIRRQNLILYDEARYYKNMYIQYIAFFSFLAISKSFMKTLVYQ